jgi:electron-transferring-flavoprotein dehydrogenase
MLAADKVHDALSDGRSNDELVGYESEWRDSEIGADLWRVRNIKSLWSRYGLLVGVALAGLYMWTNELFNMSVCGTPKHGKQDSLTFKSISEVTPIVYPQPDGS